ncbi:MAG: MBL fold metallo-hydrolase, partial [Candidatus Acidiferrales bacterium]
NNNNSLVLRLTDGGRNFMLSGDIEKKVEGVLVSENAPLPADFLKVPHHGSKTSPTEPFLEAVQPKFAVISVGESNSFGHPRPGSSSVASRGNSRVPHRPRWRSQRLDRRKFPEGSIVCGGR